MKIYKNISLITTLLVSSLSLACLNGAEQQLSTGTTLYVDHDGLIPYGHEFWLKEENRDLEKLDSLYQIKPNVKYLTEKGIVLIIQEKYKEAIDLYLSVEKKTPNLYATASNLGTAYELAGDNENALKWISRALELNSDSHNKSEWIHVNILKIKLKQAELNAQNLIGTDFGTQPLPKSNLSPKALEELINQMYFQINERISFVEPKDEILAQLLFEYGNALLANQKHLEAMEVYNMAITYGYVDPLIQERLSQIQDPNQVTESDFITKLKNNWDTILISVLSIVIFILVFRAKAKKEKYRN